METTFKVFSLFWLCVLGTTQHVVSSTITSSIRTNNGKWGGWEFCPPQTYVVAFDLTTYFHESASEDDDAGLINIYLQCSKVGSPEHAEAYISTQVEGVVVQPPTAGPVFKDITVGYSFPLRHSCEGGGLAIGFQLNSASEQGSADNTGANNIRIFCSDQKTQSPDYVEGYGNYVGEWTESQFCGARQALCGVQTQSVDMTLGRDRIGVENIRAKCCEVSNPASLCTPTQDWEIVEITPMIHTSSIMWNYSVLVGVGVISGRTVEQQQELNFYESIGFQWNVAFLSDTELGYLSSALFENILATLDPGLGGYDWETGSHINWYPLARQTHSFLVPATGSKNVTNSIYQLVARCSYLHVRSSRFKRVEVTRTSTGETTHEYEYGP